MWVGMTSTISGGGGDPKQKCPPGGGGGAYGYFVELHIVLLHEIFTFIVCKWLG